MLSLSKMQKVRVILPKARLERGIESLYEFGAIEVRECKVSDLDKPLESFGKISEMLIKLRATAKTLSLEAAVQAEPTGLAECSKDFSSLRLGELDQILAIKSDLKTRRERLSSRRLELLPFRRLGISPRDLTDGSLRYAYFKLKPKSLSSLKHAIAGVPHELLVVHDGPSEYALLAYDRRKDAEANAAALSCASTVYPIPSAGKPFDEELEGIEAEMASVEREISKAESRQAAFKKRVAPVLSGLVSRLEVLALKAELPFKFGKTDYFSVVEGWIEHEKLPAFRQGISRVPNCLVEEVSTNEEPPSKLSNPKLIAPFEFLVEFFSLPKSSELDPTIFISITFPIFFGMIMGDIGYGLVLFIAALALKLRSKSALLVRISGMLALSALSSILFGFVFAEFFGLENVFGMELHPYLHRIHEAPALINLAIFIGALHVAAGLLIGAWAKAIHGHWSHALAKLAWFGVELGMVALVVQSADISLMEFLEPAGALVPYPFSAALFAVSVVSVAKLESPTNLLELPGIISNVLSYLRIAALGISAVVLVMIINQIPVDFNGFWAMATLARPFDLGFLLSFLGFLALLVVGHIGALALGVFEASIQTLRLHYVEFFSKFYEGGGAAFRPIRAKSAEE